MSSVYKDVSRYVSAELLVKLISVISFLYVGKILIPDEFGYYAMALFVISLGSSLGEFGGASLILRDYHAKGSGCVLRALPVALGVWLLTSSLILIGGDRIWQWNPAFAALKDHPLLVSGLLLTSPLNTLVASYLVVSLRAGLFSACTVAKSIVQMTLLVVLVSYVRSYSAQLYALVIADLVCLGIPVFHFRHAVAPHVRRLLSAGTWRSVRGQVRAGFVYFSKELISVFQVHLSRIIVSAYLPIAALGIYSFFVNIVMSLGLFIVSADRVYTPRMIKMYAESPERQRNLLSSLLPVGAVASVVGYLAMIVGGEAGIYRIAFRIEYVTSSYLLDGLLFLVVTASLLQMISFSYYIGEENTSVQKQAVLNLIFVVVLQLALVPRLGLRGAVLAEVLASGLRLVSLWLLNRHILGLRTEAVKLICLLGFSIPLVSLGLFSPPLAVLSGGLIAVGAGVYAYASLGNVQEFCRLLGGGWRLAAPGNTTGV